MTPGKKTGKVDRKKLKAVAWVVPEKIAQTRPTYCSNRLASNLRSVCRRLSSLKYSSPQELQSVPGPSGPCLHSGVSVLPQLRHRGYGWLKCPRAWSILGGGTRSSSLASTIISSWRPLFPPRYAIGVAVAVSMDEAAATRTSRRRLSKLSAAGLRSIAASGGC